MSGVSRRQFLNAAAAGGVGAACVGAMPALAGFQPGPGPEVYDLLIRGGQVIDPSQGLRGDRDVAIRDGRIAAVAQGIPADRAKAVISAGGLLVLPGLVDIHAHVYDRATTFGLGADALAPLTGVTTCVDAGTAGANTYEGFQQWVVDRSATRIFAFVHISRMGLAGLPVGELLNLDYADVDAAVKVLTAHRDVILGVKVRQGRAQVGDNGLEPLRRAIAAAERAGAGARVMCHIGAVPGNLSELLDLLRPGDVLTHVYSGAGNNIVQDGRILPAALSAKARGVLFDVGHGGGSFDFTMAEPAMAQGLLPDTIGADLHADSIKTAGKPYMPWVMSKFLSLGVPLEQVVAMVTVNPAKVIARVPGLGTLQAGAPADVTLMQLVEQPVTVEDTNGHRRAGKGYLRPVETLRAGRSLGRVDPATIPYP